MAQSKEIRTEEDVLQDLELLCQSPGYAHAIAFFCFRDNTIKYFKEVTLKDMLNQFSDEGLVRTEISTLIAFLCKSRIDEMLPIPVKLQYYIDKTEKLLEEIHKLMLPLQEIFDPAKLGSPNFNPLESGSVLREAIFYGSDSAYHFQYRDFSKIKYKKDNDWFIANKGYSLNQVIKVVSSIHSLQNDKINEFLDNLRNNHPDNWNFLNAYIFTAEEVTAKSGIELDCTKKVISSFISTDGLENFQSLDDFNPKNAYPIIQLDGDRYLLFQNYSLWEALYETPFFWFISDKKYEAEAMRHRGEFTEEFATNRLKLVFGEARIFNNVNIFDSKKNKAGEIDVLVVFANRAIVLQAKSKKLTIAARKGNDYNLRQDFKKAVQEAYDQAFSCSTLLLNKENKLVNEKGNTINVNRDFSEIYPFCVVSDHYPALSWQAKQFLKQKPSLVIKPALVMDIFFLDVMTEMLQSPLYLLNYINRKALYDEKVISVNELTIFSYHLKHNLCIGDKFTEMAILEDFCADLDIAMLARRDGVPGVKTPDGILTKFKGSYFDQIINDIEKYEHPGAVDLGFFLLSLGSDSIEIINDGIIMLVERGKADGKCHDMTIGISEGSTGLTIHCNDDPYLQSTQYLMRHCELRKYEQKANQWFGLCIGIKTPRLRFAIKKEFKWERSHEMDELSKCLTKPQEIKGNKINFKTAVRKLKKVGRNEKCPCGSGKKYKKCCL